MNRNLQSLLDTLEGENCEFKEAKHDYSVDKLLQYACGIANSGGGKIVLGVSDSRPRQVVGTNAFPQPERTRSHLMDKLPLRIGVQTFRENEKRILVFQIPPRPTGVPMQLEGRYWTRRGDSLTQMTETDLRDIFAESGHDFSADVCQHAQWSDLDHQAIEDFRQRWVTKSGNQRLETLPLEQLLKDCEAITQQGGITYTALILFGTHEALGRLLGQCEIIFEYRHTEASGPAQFRRVFRQGFFSIYDQIWELINLRNHFQHFQSGLFIFDVPTFEERTIREALLNAVSHRNYQSAGSIFIRQYPLRIVLESPGGLPPDITLDNILERQSPRNRRLADVFSKCGLVERSGQGMNLMYEWSIKQAKQIPDLSKTDRHHVQVELDGTVQDMQLLVMLEKISRETLTQFTTEDFLIIDYVRQEEKIPEPMKNRVQQLIDLGVLERAGRGRLLLAQRYYQVIGQKGTYTRKKGLNREEQKALLLKHIRSSGTEGAPLRELCQVLPACKDTTIQVFLRELRDEGTIILSGNTRGGRWVINGTKGKK